MSALVTVVGLVVGGGLVGAGLLVILAGYAPNYPELSRNIGATLLFPGLGFLLMQGMGHGSGVLAWLCGLAGIVCFGLGAWLGFRYLPLVLAKSRNRTQ
ncbi:hypothetical protein ACFHW1_28515 [Micromonospora sp. LOL_014]|uniref:hypothetical protein n=1 Tax=Micromonospora sp. LOL_014 TaxID=3345415 RepID=UPI003A8C5AE6